MIYAASPLILPKDLVRGYTKLKKCRKLKSVANRMLIFDSDLEHAVFTCTDEQNRVVVNFNYTEL